jgi:flagellar biogenesis protein FliO
MKTLKILLTICIPLLSLYADAPAVKLNSPDFSEELCLSESTTSLDLATTSYETAFLRMLFVLIGLLIVLCLGVFLFKKYASSRLQQSNHTRNIKILEKRVISPKSMLYLIEVGGKTMLIGESQLELRHLSALEWIESEKKGL